MVSSLLHCSLKDVSANDRPWQVSISLKACDDDNVMGDHKELKHLLRVQL